MSEEIIFERPYVIVKYIPDKKLVQLIWNGTATSEQYQEAFVKGLDFQEQCKTPVYNFLSDVRKQGSVSPETRKWFETVVVPRTVKQGLRRGAVVFDGSIFKKYYLNIILQATNRFKLPFKFFYTDEQAYEWFDSFNE
jgi:hypothetical protein